MIERFEKFSFFVFHMTRYWNKIATEEMKRYNMKGSYGLYLVVLDRAEEGLTAAALCDMCGKDKADVSRGVSEMEKKGLLRRIGDSSYRAKLILTEEGKNVAAHLNKRASLFVEIAGEGLSEEHRQIFYDSLELISDNLKKYSKENTM